MDDYDDLAEHEALLARTFTIIENYLKEASEEATEQLRQMKNTYVSELRQARDAINKVEGLNSRIKFFEGKNEAINQENDGLKEENKKLKAKIKKLDELEKDIQEERALSSTLSENLKDLKKKNEELTESNTLLNKMNARIAEGMRLLYEQKNDNINQILRDMQQKLNNLTTENEGLREQLAVSREVQMQAKEEKLRL